MHRKQHSVVCNGNAQRRDCTLRSTPNWIENVLNLQCTVSLDRGTLGPTGFVPAQPRDRKTGAHLVLVPFPFRSHHPPSSDIALLRLPSPFRPAELLRCSSRRSTTSWRKVSARTLSFGRGRNPHGGAWGHMLDPRGRIECGGVGARGATSMAPRETRCRCVEQPSGEENISARQSARGAAVGSPQKAKTSF